MLACQQDLAVAQAAAREELDRRQRIRGELATRDEQVRSQRAALFHHLGEVLGNPLPKGMTNSGHTGLLQGISRLGASLNETRTLHARLQEQFRNEQSALRRAKTQYGALQEQYRSALGQLRELRQRPVAPSSTTGLPAGPISRDLAAMAMKRYFMQGVRATPPDEQVQMIRNLNRRWHADKWPVTDKCSQHESDLIRQVHRLLTEDSAFRLSSHDPPLTAGSHVDVQGYGATATPSDWKRWVTDLE